MNACYNSRSGGLQELIYSQRMWKLLQGKWKRLDMENKTAVWFPDPIKAAKGMDYGNDVHPQENLVPESE